MSAKKLDLNNKRFGWLTVLGEVLPSPFNNSSAWKCRCRCGNVKIIKGWALKSKNTGTCGCRRNVDLRAKELGLTAAQYKYLKKSYRDQRHSAGRRGIAFLLTWEQWIKIWIKSGKFHLRGRRFDQYVMARFGDRGSYSVDNVSIITVSQNSIDACRNNGQTKLTTAQVSTIKRLYIKSSRRFGATKLAKKFNVDPSTVRAIVTGKVWSHVR